jgi:hypothetical protein
MVQGVVLGSGSAGISAFFRWYSVGIRLASDGMLNVAFVAGHIVQTN